MARFFRLIYLALRRGFYVRSRSVVYFGMSIFVPSLLCMYWIFAVRDNPTLAERFSIPHIVSYYVTVVTLSALLVSHMKEWIMREEIQQGGLSRMLLKPYSYYIFNTLFHEFPYRIVQGGYGMLVVAVLMVFVPQTLTITTALPQVLLGVVSSIFGFFLCHTIEMVLGFLAFWFYDLRLVHNAYDTIFILLGGVNMPLYLLPESMERIAFATPLPYIIYVPTLLLTDQAPPEAIGSLLITQIAWLLGAGIVYFFIWRAGLRVYTAAGS